uniref:Uncharacterized protein LOC102804420 n=1 Tax=Saccoglossus kowalevskii TaxID=10224 RepID=A0ABM0MMR3_SACKO|nr:PREDICTED: uncharacterized protein LOC102804420 [Saccoglossus kowalevskii]
MKALWSQTAPDYTAALLREFHDNLEVSVRSLKALGKDKAGYEELLIPMLLSRLPIPFQQQLSRSNSSEDWTVALLSKHMIQEIKVLDIGQKSEIIDSNPYNASIAAFTTNSQKPQTDNVSAFNGTFRNKEYQPPVGTRNTVNKMESNFSRPQKPLQCIYYKYWEFVGDHIIQGCSPVTVSSAFGYLRLGPINTGKRRSCNIQTFHVSTLKSPDEQLDTMIASFWDLETIGVKDTLTRNDTKSMSHNEQYRNYTDHCLTEHDGRFTAKLPWKTNHATLPTNFDSAQVCTRNMVAKLPSKLVTVYDNIIREQIEKGYIEEVTQDNSEVGHYLPHRSVKKDSKTTPIRVVYDCSATPGKGQPSLNQCLDTGPPMLNSLTSILLRFRANPIALTADIEKAFLQIKLDERERKFTKFLWLSNADNINSSFKTYQFASLLFGATCSPFILNAAIRNLTDSHIHKPVARDIHVQQNIYVDDVVSGCSNTTEAINFYEQSTSIFATRKFNLHLWNTNDTFLHTVMNNNGRSNMNTNISVLGLRWNSDDDTLRVKPPKVPNFGSYTTKRDIVGYSASLYDPLGLFSSIQIRAKLLIQTLWLSNHNWDMPITKEL